MRFWAVIGAVFAGSVLLGACGDEDGSAETTAADACAARTLVTSADGANPTSTLPPDDSAVAAAVGGSLCAPLQLTSADGSTMAFDPAVSEADGMCIGTELVDAFGAARVREFWPLTTRALSAEEAETVVNILEDCSERWELLLLPQRPTTSPDHMSEASAECVMAALKDDDARAVMERQLRGEPVHSDPLTVALKQCGKAV